MHKNELLNNLLFLLNDLVFTVDLNQKVIKDVYKSNKLITSEVSYQDFCKLLMDTFDLLPTFEAKLLRFFKNLDLSDDPFSLSINYTKTDNTPISINYNGYKYDDHNVLFLVQSEKVNNYNTKDELTKSYTKTFMMEKVREAIESETTFALMILDIDNFKLFNDTYGHMFGDIILIETVASVRKYLGNRGYIGRIGGDEFLVLIYIDDVYDLKHSACTDVRRAISDLSGTNIKKATITATVGCVSYPHDGDNYEILFKKADKALYRGKKKGRNCFVIYTEERCGPVTLNDDVEITEKAMDRVFNQTGNYNIISGAIELLNRDDILKKNLENTIALIGNYFLLDRIVMSVINPDTNEFEDTFVWYNPRMPKYPVNPNEQRIASWKMVLDQTASIKLNQVSSNIHLPIYEELSEDKTSALAAYEMSYENKTFGLVRFEMCSINRFWTQTDLSALMLIAKTIAIRLNREYLNKMHYNDLYIDKLTKLHNFEGWRNHAKQFIAFNKDIKYSLIYFDIKDFTTLTNIIGSKAADNLLIRIANLIKMDCQDSIYCRVSADKFIILTPHSDPNDIEYAFNELLKNINSNNTNVYIRGACYIAKENEDLDEAYDKVVLTHNSFQDGGLHFFSEELLNEKREETKYQLHMKTALKNGEFKLFLQPKIDPKTNELTGAEALTRWYYKNETLLSPYKYIPLFERIGFITSLDYYVFEEVCKFQANAIKNNKKTIPISVNISRYTKNFDEYYNKINAIREKYNVPINLIDLEITEGMYTDNFKDVAVFVEKLHNLGYQIHIDDFGTGYSNLITLAKIKFDVLKLDKSLCDNYDSKGKKLLQAILAAANEIGVRTVAEGIETENQVEYFKKIGVDYIQGYFYDKPLPQNEFEDKYLKK